MFSIATHSLEGSVCRDLPEDQKKLFFSESGSGYKEAKRICKTCPVIAECLENTLFFDRQVDVNYIYGVAGGMAAKERERLLQDAG